MNFSTNYTKEFVCQACKSLIAVIGLMYVN